MSKTRANIASDQSKLDFSVRLMEHLVVPTFVLDAHCRVIIWNRACERLTGIKAGEVLGTSEHWRGFYEEPRPCLADLIAQRRTDEIESLYAEHDRHGSESQLALGRRAENWCVMPCAGTRLYLAIDAGPIYDDAGQLVAVVETLRDITAQKVAQDELQRLATRDGLTGVANRRSFDTALNTECRRVSREARALSLLMIDVDFFKRYNDTYGHLAGDECLRQVAEAMAQVTQRASDTLARYGGEEFAILLPATEPAGAVIVAERIRAAVEGLALPHARSDVGPHVTVSIGVASIDPASAAPPTELIGAADAALYAAKMQGRNRVVQAGAGEAAPSR
ncbi:MAG: diguanylate cyclase [Betaproteobacteria bacterium]|nr:diguanylate cyclase [Betaproteobacteria bacterium]